MGTPFLTNVFMSRVLGSHCGMRSHWPDCFALCEPGAGYMSSKGPGTGGRDGHLQELGTRRRLRGPVTVRSDLRVP